MDYIDWIISSFIFLITVSLILVAISSIIPINPNDDFLSKSLFVSTVENIPVYNFYVNRTEEEILPFSFTLENTDGVGQNIFAIDGNNYFGVIQNDNRFFNYTNPNAYFWAEKETDTNFEIQLEENAGLNLDITEIENLKLWLDASSLELNDNDLVGSWTDLSGNNNHATQSNDTNKPTFKENILNGKPVIRFDGNGTVLTTPNLQLTENKYSIFSVLKNTKTSGASGLWSFFYYYQGLYFGNNSWRGSGYGANYVRMNNASNNVFLINSVIKNGGTTLQDVNFNLKIYNNTTDRTGTIGTDTHTFETSNNVALKIGRWGDAAYSFGGDLSEFIVFNKVLTDNERLTVENYLSQKYAITVANGVVFNGNSVEVYNQNTNEIETTIEFLNKNTLMPADCNYSYINKKIVVGDCQTDIIIKSKYNFKELKKTSYELSQPKGIQVLKESFNDFDYSDNFTIVPDANINAGILVLENPSTITSNNSHYDYLGFLSVTNFITAYISYTDVNNNYFCRFGDSTITIGKTENSTQTILKTTSYSKTTDWHRVYFGYTKENLINCNAGDTKTYYQDENTIPKTQIVISTIYNNTLIDDFYIYLNNDLESNSSGTIIGNYVDANVTNNLITIKTTDNDLSSTLDFNFSEGLVVTDGNGISFVKDSEEENKLLFFPQTKEFWMFKDADDNIEINLDSNTGLNLNISEIQNLALWLDASSLNLNNNDLVSNWTDLSDNNYHATQSEDGNKPTYKTNILNEKPTIRFNGEQYLQTNEFTNPLEQPNTAFVVFSAEPNTGYILLDGIADGLRNTFGSSGPETNTVSIFAGAAVINSGETLPQSWSLWTSIFNTTSSKILKNGLEKITGSIGANYLTGLTIGCRYSLTRFMIGDISEILLYDAALSDSNRLLVENYLSQKYDLPIENGLSFTDNSIELINLNDNSKIMKFEFFDIETNTPVDCNYEYKNKKITISGCEADVIIKTRFRLAGVATFPEYPNISITKTKEQMITKEKLDSLSNQDYYIRLSNKVKTLENIARIPAKKIYKNFSKLLLENGFIEEVVVEVKSFT